MNSTVPMVMMTTTRVRMKNHSSSVRPPESGKRKGRGEEREGGREEGWEEEGRKGERKGERDEGWEEEGKAAGREGVKRGKIGRASCRERV